MNRLRAGHGLALALMLLCGPTRGAAQAAEFAVRAAPAVEGWRPVVQTSGLLRDRALRGALDSGLPLRFHLRLELWRKGVFDQLAEATDVFLALVQDPLDRTYRLETERGELRFGSLAEAQTAIESSFRPALRPGGSGRFYYLASLEVETLSLSDLEELRHWLRGEVGPAVEGRGSAARAVERGLRRVLVRVIGLPTRRYEARSATFERR